MFEKTFIVKGEVLKEKFKEEVANDSKSSLVTDSYDNGVINVKLDDINSDNWYWVTTYYDPTDKENLNCIRVAEVTLVEETKEFDEWFKF